MKPTPDSKIGLRLFATVWALQFIVWAFANWHGLTSAWWYLDDYHKLTDWVGAVPQVLSHGRPLEVLWLLTFRMDGQPHGEWQNIALRFFQGGVHCVAATAAAAILWRQRRSWHAFLSVLPFVLWPFNAEAVLWRSTGNYPFGALFGICGVWLIQYPGRRPCAAAVTGGCSIVAAMLLNQAAAFSGLVVQLIVSALIILQDEVPWRPQCRKVATTCLGYLVGGLSSYAVAHLHGSYRAQFAADASDKLSYLWQLNDLFLLWPRFYPRWLSGLHIALLILTVAAVAGAVVSRRSSWFGRRAAASLLLLSTAFVVPYAGVLLAAEDWPSWRVMYLAPFLIAGMWNELDMALAALRVNAVIALCPLLLIVMGYIPIARVNSAEYVRLFQNDVEVLRQIETYSVTEGIGTIFVAPPPANVYRLVWGARKHSAFYKDWAARPFIAGFSALRPAYDDETRGECLLRCADGHNGASRRLIYHKIQKDTVVCVCWGDAVPVTRRLH